MRTRSRLEVMCIVLVITSATAWPHHAYGGFTNGIETFDGTTLDSTIWDPPLTSSGSSVSQNDAIIFEGAQLAQGRYNTKTRTIEIGEIVSADVIITEPVSPLPNTTVSATLALTTKDNAQPGQGGAATESLFDSLALSVTMSRFPSNPSIGRISGFLSEGGAGNGFLIANNVTFLDTLYRFQIERLTATTTRLSASIVNGPTFASVDRTHPAIDDLFITLQGINGRVQMDNVRIVPEPSNIVMATLGLVSLVAYSWKRRHRSMSVCAT